MHRVGAHSAAQLWKEKDTKRFWNAITDFLLEHVMNETDFSTEMGDETIVNTLIERVKNGKYEFSRRHRQEVWSVFIIFLYNFDKPAVPENLAKTLKKSGIFFIMEAIIHFLTIFISIYLRSISIGSK